MTRKRRKGTLRRGVPLFLGRYEVHGHSMEPALRAGDRVLVSRVAFGIQGPRRGEVVAFRHPNRPHEVLLKRLVGLPGDFFQSDGDRLTLERSPRDHAESDAMPGRRLDPDEYLVLGDRLDHSEDSRLFGPVTRDLILGKVWLRYWPADMVGPLAGSPEAANP